ncbi:MAG: SCO family protein [Candidatus Methylacidiphilales bacterium]
MKNNITIIFFALIFAVSCGKKQLPIMGERAVDVKIVDGKEVVDTIYQTVPNFSFLNQDSTIITQEVVKNKIYVADFFFVTCPTICPRMKKNMLTIYNTFKGNQNVVFLSHTIDPDHDSVSVLCDFANRLGADSKQWHFLTGNRDSIYELATHGYYATALPDSTEPGGYVHSGGLILIDKYRRVRGIYDGTNEKDATILISDIDLLLNEKE